ncbi:MAG: hypothetical protein ACRC92_18645 [Peptostreptococcaceae bacterium]
MDYIKTLKSRPYLALNKNFMTELLKDMSISDIIKLIGETSLAVIDHISDEDKIGVVASFGGVGFDSIDLRNLSIIDKVRYYELISMLDIDMVVISDLSSSAFDIDSIDLFCEGVEDEILSCRERKLSGEQVHKDEFNRYLKAINIIIYHVPANGDITSRLNTTEVMLMEELDMIHDCDDSIYITEDMRVCEDLNKAPSNRY